MFFVCLYASRSYNVIHQTAQKTTYGSILFKKTLDPAYCEKLQTLSTKSEGNTCFAYFAEIKSDISWCEKVKNPDTKAYCRAYVSKNPEECYALSRDDHDIAGYSRGVGFCIGDVVKRSKDYTMCLAIDSLEYGRQWEIQRNECLEKAAYFADREGRMTDLKNICDSMVEVREEYWPRDFKEECYQGSVTDYSHTLPPQLNW